jgi:hypothetical protein
MLNIKGWLLATGDLFVTMTASATNPPPGQRIFFCNGLGRSGTAAERNCTKYNQVMNNRNHSGAGTSSVSRFMAWLLGFMGFNVIAIPLGIFNYVYRLLYGESYLYLHDVEPTPDFREPIVVKEPVVFCSWDGCGDDTSTPLPPYWPQVRDVFPNAITPSNLTLASCRDRAIDLFYYIKGGRTDFGEEHSRACGHVRYGHSAGGPTYATCWRPTASPATTSYPCSGPPCTTRQGRNSMTCSRASCTSSITSLTTVTS